MKQFLTLFIGPNGDTSSKRVCGIALIAASIVGAFTGRDTATIIALLGAGCTILGVQAITRT